jgi:hypothetical protein
MRPRIHPLVPIGLAGLGLIGFNALGLNPAKILPKGPSPEDRLKAEIKQVGPEFPGIYEATFHAPTCRVQIFDSNENVVQTTTQPLAFDYYDGKITLPHGFFSKNVTNRRTSIAGNPADILALVDQQKLDADKQAVTLCQGLANRKATNLQVDKRSQAPFQGVGNLKPTTLLSGYTVRLPQR